MSTQRFLAKLFGAALLVVTLASCATRQYPITSPYYRIPAGSQIVLNEPLTIPPNNARIYLQYGRVITPREKDRYHANCWFLSWKVLETSQTIQPDAFMVIDSQKTQEFVQNPPGVMYASRFSTQIDIHGGIGIGIGIGAAMDPASGDSPMAAEYTTTLKIHSDRQPDIRRFACSHWDGPFSGEHLTVEQMQQALGDIVSIGVKNDK